MSNQDRENLLFGNFYMTTLQMFERTIRRAVKTNESEGLRWLEKSTGEMIRKGLKELKAEGRRNL